MRRSIATVCVSGTLSEKLEAIAMARFDGVEIFENDLIFHPGRPAEIRQMAADLGLTIDLFQPFRDFEGVSPEKFKQNLDRAERKFDLMGELGASLILVCSNVSPDAIGNDELAAQQLHELASHAARHGIRIGYEALSWGAKVHTFQHAWSIVEKADHPHLGLIVDSYHTLVLPDDWSSLSQIPGNRIFYVQLADAPRLDMGALMLSRHFRCFPGQGEMDVAGFVHSVLATGYAGPISLEIFNDDMRAAPPRQTALDGIRSLHFVEEQVRRIEESELLPPSKSSIRKRVELFDPPAEPALDGIDFVEFALDEASAKGLAALLTAMGFACIGRHRSKAVTLWARGSVRFVLNLDRQGFAHSYFLMHGPSVCAIAIKTDDPVSAMSRAAAYGCQRYEGRVGQHEQTIPAIRTPDGSLIYFTSLDENGNSQFEADFVVEVSKKDSQNLSVDHVAQALPVGQLDSWVLFYRTVLGLKPEASIVLADPYGLVRARAVSNASRSLRFPLSLSEGNRTTVARSVSTYSGAGVSHIALATDDIFASARSLSITGVTILPIPANYYDDILARFGLEPEFADLLKAHNILYDRVEEGSFLHFYTLPFEERFFFEFVQRLDHYDLYGAPNAPVRMAALAHARPADLSSLLR